MQPFVYLSVLDTRVFVRLLGLRLPGLDAHLPDVELAAAPPVGPADHGFLLPAQLHDHQVSNVHIGGDEEGQGGVTVQHRPGGGGEEGRSIICSWYLPS